MVKLLWDCFTLAKSFNAAISLFPFFGFHPINFIWRFDGFVHKSEKSDLCVHNSNTVYTLLLH